MERVILAGAIVATTAAIACAFAAVLAIGVAVATRAEDEYPGVGCALLGLVWAAIAALLFWMIRG